MSCAFSRCSCTTMRRSETPTGTGSPSWPCRRRRPRRDTEKRRLGEGPLRAARAGGERGKAGGRDPSPRGKGTLERNLRKTAIRIAVSAYFGALLLITAGLGYSWYQGGQAPDQPIAFPHTIHASELKSPCHF